MLAKEYANALFELASSNNKTKEINNNFELLISGIKENPDFIKVLTFPRISKAQKKDSIKTITKGFEDIFVRFLYVLIDNGRISYLEQIFEEYNNIIKNNNNILDVKVVSAKKLTSKQISELSDKLNKYYNRNVVINNEVDETIIGGVKILANGESLDFTVMGKLNLLKDNM